MTINQESFFFLPVSIIKSNRKMYRGEIMVFFHYSTNVLWLLACRYYSETRTIQITARNNQILRHCILPLYIHHVRHMRASFNSRSLVYGCSTVMHASRYACNKRAEERVKADMRVRDCVCAHMSTVSRSLQYTRS